MKRNMSGILKMVCVFICLILLVFFPFTNALAEIYEPAKAPKIVSFTASSVNVAAGETVVLEWEVINATSIQIKGVEQSGELPLRGSIEVHPLKKTNFVLTATGAGGTRSKSITVEVDVVADVTIDYFTASAMEVESGNTVELSWKTTNANRISIIGLEKTEEDVILPVTGSLEAFPTDTTKYYLRAVGDNNEVVIKTITVTVIEPVPSIPSNELLVLDKELHDWGAEYILDVDIVNLSNTVVKDWTLTLKKSEFTITIIWGVTMEEYGDYIIISPLHYNHVIKDGGTASFGFEALDSPKPDFYYKFDIIWDV